MTTFTLSRVALSINLAAALLSACGRAQPPLGVPGAIPQAPAGAARSAQAPRSFLYMAQCCAGFSYKGSVTLYDLGLTKDAHTITKGVSNPWALTVDRARRLYMVGFGYTQGVIEFDAGSDRPSRRVKLSYASAAATDASNNLYAASCPACQRAAIQIDGMAVG